MIPRTITIAGAALLLVASAAAAQANPVTFGKSTPPISASDASLKTTWQVDPAHSQLQFTVRHLVGKVSGTFDGWSGTLRTNGEQWTRGTADVSIRTATLNTRNSVRDADLRSTRFFDVKQFPAITFSSTGMIQEGDRVELGGLLTIKGNTRPVVLAGQFLGRGRGKDGKLRMGFEASTVVDRKTFGLTYNDLIDGTPLIGDSAMVTISLEAIEVPQVAAPKKKP